MRVTTERRTLIPRTLIDIEGKLVYNEAFQAWNTIRFKKELLDEFPKLKDKHSKFSYELKYFRDAAELEKLMKELKIIMI